ncbi:hypothetical protein MATL_G00183770 [Megalops atlanticus]|uniref:Uncharacterized protein n=1 Tax=Megalops atlanticus TaxID=7932 RepID=A0A9D3PQ47_MEGAT|nr:hypothetical protein MATL_G00183770 [Megalops atlanticus]
MSLSPYQTQPQAPASSLSTPAERASFWHMDSPCFKCHTDSSFSQLCAFVFLPRPAPHAAGAADWLRGPASSSCASLARLHRDTRTQRPPRCFCPCHRAASATTDTPHHPTGR